jgi:hypothetical protein
LTSITEKSALPGQNQCQQFLATEIFPMRSLITLQIPIAREYRSLWQQVQSFPGKIFPQHLKSFSRCFIELTSWDLDVPLSVATLNLRSNLSSSFPLIWLDNESLEFHFAVEPSPRAANLICERDPRQPPVILSQPIAADLLLPPTLAQPLLQPAHYSACRNALDTSIL